MQIKETSEFLTLVQDNRSVNSVPPGSVPMQIHHWGQSRISPAGAPIPPPMSINAQIQDQLPKGAIWWEDPKSPSPQQPVVQSGGPVVPAQVQPAQFPPTQTTTVVKQPSNPVVTPAPSFSPSPAYTPSPSYSPKPVATNPVRTAPTLPTSSSNPPNAQARTIVQPVAEVRSPVPVLIPRACVCDCQTVKKPMPMAYPPSRQTTATIGTNSNELSVPVARPPTIVVEAYVNIPAVTPLNRKNSGDYGSNIRSPAAPLPTYPLSPAVAPEIRNAKSNPVPSAKTQIVSDSPRPKHPILDFWFGNRDTASSRDTAQSAQKPISPPAPSPFLNTAQNSSDLKPRTIASSTESKTSSTQANLKLSQDPNGLLPDIQPNRSGTAQAQAKSVPSSQVQPIWDPLPSARAPLDKTKESEFATIRPTVPTTSAIRQTGAVVPSPVKDKGDPFDLSAQAQQNPGQPSGQPGEPRPFQLTQNTGSPFGPLPQPPSSAVASAPPAKSNDSPGFFGWKPKLFFKDTVPPSADPVPLDPNSANATDKTRPFPTAPKTATGPALVAQASSANVSPGRPPFSTSPLVEPPAPNRISALASLPLPPTYDGKTQTVSATVPTPSVPQASAFPLAPPANALPPDTKNDWRKQWGNQPSLLTPSTLPRSTDDILNNPEKFNPKPKYLPTPPTVAEPKDTKTQQAGAAVQQPGTSPNTPLAGQGQTAAGSPYPPGSASVLAARNGVPAQMFYVPVPVSTGPDPSRARRRRL